MEQELLRELIYAIRDLKTNGFLEFVKFWVSIITSCLTIWIAWLTFKLQKQVKKESDKEKKEQNSHYAGDIYYFLNDILYKMADVSFNYNSFSTITIDGKQYMQDINYLRYKIISNDEFKMLREIYLLYDGIKKDSKANEKNFKILYKKIIDNNISPDDIVEYRKNNMIDNIASIKLLTILKKLEFVMNDSINEQDDIIINFNNDSYQVEKKYKGKYYIKNVDGNISGYVEQYEIVLTFENPIRLDSEIVYNGYIENGKYFGKGKYYYYTKQNGFNNKINSCDLDKEGINLDVVAQEIKNRMIEIIPNGWFKAAYKGTFKNGNIDKGIIEYQKNSTDDIKTINYNNEE